MRELRHFAPQEFRGWYPRMDRRLLHLLDDFRDQLGEPVMISPAHGSIGRHLGLDSLSWHNIDMRGSVRAIDIMIPGYNADELCCSQGSDRAGAAHRFWGGRDLP